MGAARGEPGSDTLALLTGNIGLRAEFLDTVAACEQPLASMAAVDPRRSDPESGALLVVAADRPLADVLREALGWVAPTLAGPDR